MGRDIAFDTPLGSIGGWRADPVEAPRGALVVVQEIFGVNAHMRSVADRYAADRLRGAGAGVLRPGRARGRTGLRRRRRRQGPRAGRRAGLRQGRSRSSMPRRNCCSGEGLKVGVVGFCWGGTVALLANRAWACRR